MNNHTMNSSSRLLKNGLLFLFAGFLFLGACSKTEYEYEKEPYKEIESFVLPGYSGDSIHAVIHNGEIIVYWAAEATLPSTINPSIAVSPNAIISPASGTEVAFNEETVYTVTAADGSTQTYRLKPVINQAIPKISKITPTSLAWISNTKVTVSGEYFLAGDTSNVHVYAQRLRDGFEFDLDIDRTQLSMTNITASLPKYTTQLDTGLHKIWVKIGDRVSDAQEVNIRIPAIPSTDVNGLFHMTFVEAGKTLVAGDSVTLKFWDDYNGDVAKWYAKKFTKLNFENYTFEAKDLSQTDSTIKFKLPDFPIIRKPSNVILYYVDGFQNSTYLARILPQSSWPIIPVQN